MNIGNSGTLGRWVTARHMALAGYITKIIMIRDWSDLQTGQTALPGSGEGRIYSGTKIQNFPGWCDTDS